MRAKEDVHISFLRAIHSELELERLRPKKDKKALIKEFNWGLLQ